MSDGPTPDPVLILGAGINGCALARELVLNGVPVFLVDQADIATGATAKSSRLIHGGLRYLEYGDFRLVAESLRERERLLELAPQFVRPLKLFIPVARRFGGFLQAGFRFLRLSRFSFGRFLERWLPVHSERGLIVVRIGLWFYDWLARSSLLPNHFLLRVGAPGTPAVDDKAFHWLCGYYDAQMPYPERFVLALLEDARYVAAESNVAFHVLTHHRATIRNASVEIGSVNGDGLTHQVAPSAIVNATGAWGDITLEQIDVEAEQLLGGTKGSHFITSHAGLKRALGEGGVYAEAADGRLVFILPFADSVLVGTTDERFSGPPDEAIASDEELRYLVGMVNDVFPQVDLDIADVAVHYSGVRPLPFVPAGQTGSIPRGHWIHSSVKEGIPVETLIGGKLTTCRAFAEEVADRLLDRLQVRRTTQTRERTVPGAEEFPADVHRWCRDVAAETGFSAEQVETVFPLVGTRARGILVGGGSADGSGSPDARSSVPGTNLPIRFVDWSIEYEWVHTLGDLVERRLGLVFAPGLSRQTLEVLADRLCHAGLLTADSRDAEIDACLDNLCRQYGVSKLASL